MDTLPQIGELYSDSIEQVRVTRVTAMSGKYRWIYYRTVPDNDFRCWRLDFFLKRYSK